MFIKCIKSWKAFKGIWQETELAEMRLGLLHFLGSIDPKKRWGVAGPNNDELEDFYLDTMEQCLDEAHPEDLHGNDFNVVCNALVKIFQKCLLLLVDLYEKLSLWPTCEDRQMRVVRLLADRRVYYPHPGMQVFLKEPYSRKITLFLNSCIIGVKPTLNWHKLIAEEWYRAAIYSGNDKLLYDRVMHVSKDQDPMFDILKDYFDKILENGSLHQLMYMNCDSADKQKTNSLIVLFLYLAMMSGRLKEIEGIIPLPKPSE